MNNCLNFTQRELEILELLTKGYTNHKIASLLFLDHKTVEHHCHNIYGKMEALDPNKIMNKRVFATKVYMAYKRYNNGIGIYDHRLLMEIGQGVAAI